MADITFAKPTFTDGVSQVSAATFQPIADALDAVVKRAWISTTATGGEDGNGGQPPSAKPNRTIGSPPGYFGVVLHSDGNAVSVPALGGQVKWYSMTGVNIGTTGTTQGISASGAALGNQTGSAVVMYERIS
jgi:hypothetical protein